MPTKWTINHAGTDANGTELIGCHIAAVGTAYQFQKPDGTMVQTTSTTAPSLPATPFNFDMFNSALAGTNAVNWYITVDTFTDGESKNKAKGKWGNTGYPPEFAETDTDTWTTQAGVGIEPDEDQGEDQDNDRAAYASPKL